MDDSAFMTAHLHRCHRFSASNVILAGATLQIVRVVTQGIRPYALCQSVENRHPAEENGPHTSPYLSFYGRLYGGNMCNVKT